MGNIVNKFLYQPPSEKMEPISNLIYLRNKKGGIIYCYYFDRSYKYTILFSHGNAETIHLAKNFIENHLLKNIKRVNVMVYEYTGYTSRTKQTKIKKLYETITCYTYLYFIKKSSQM